MHRVARCPQIAFGGLLIGGRLFDVVLRNRLGRIELAQARQIARGQVGNARRRYQRRLGLQQIGAIDGEQCLPLLHVVTDRAEQRDDPPLIRREHLHRQLLVEVDAADRLLLDRKVALLDWRDLHRDELQIRQIHAVPIVGGLMRCIGPLGIGCRGRIDRQFRAVTRVPRPIANDRDGDSRAGDRHSQPAAGRAGGHRQAFPRVKGEAATWPFFVPRGLL